MKVYIINTKTNEVVYQNDEVFSMRRRTIYKNDEKTKYFEIEERSGYQLLFEVTQHRIFKTLGEDAVAAYNEEWIEYGGGEKKLGENWKTQLYDYCKTMAPAFEKIVGSYQGVAFPFEMRMAIEGLREVKESEND
jgi:hypothetical protein